RRIAVPVCVCPCRDRRRVRPRYHARRALHGMLERLIDYSPYVGILAALCLGSLGAPIPEEIPVVTAGLLARQEVVRWWLALPLCVVGVLSGDIALYWVGRHWGEHVLELRLVRRVLDPARREKLTAAYRKNGLIIVFAARHVM